MSTERIAEIRERLNLIAHRAFLELRGDSDDDTLKEYVSEFLDVSLGLLTQLQSAREVMEQSDIALLVPSKENSCVARDAIRRWLKGEGDGQVCRGR